MAEAWFPTPSASLGSLPHAGVSQADQNYAPPSGGPWRVGETQNVWFQYGLVGGRGKHKGVGNWNKSLSKNGEERALGRELACGKGAIPGTWTVTITAEEEANCSCHPAGIDCPAVLCALYLSHCLILLCSVLSLLLPPSPLPGMLGSSLLPSRAP